MTDRDTRADRIEYGEAARRRTPLAALAEHDSVHGRDPVELLEIQAAIRVPDLVPVRYGRMAVSAFTFFRGAASVMADDLSRTPTSGVHTQLCGDAHLSNFGLFATPERALAFDLNDFDETYPGPFEWDVKRLITSLVVAGRVNGFGRKQRQRIARACATEYRETMAFQAESSELAVWYSHIDAEKEVTELHSVLDSSMRKRIRKTLDKSRSRDSVSALSKLTTRVDGIPRIVSMPPLIVPIDELLSAHDAEAVTREMIGRLREYGQTLPPHYRILLERFEFLQMARKVVGVGSVGTRAWVLLLRGLGDDPLFLQAKEAQPSVLAAYVDGPSFVNQGERVVAGQKLMQATGDILLGWQQGPGIDGVQRDFYIRQLRDGKGSAVIETMTPELMSLYGRLCARVLAHAHARAGDRFSIAGYLGSDEDFDDALTRFGESYADQNERDHAALCQAIENGRITAHTGI
ncbi:DUF2252 domain-containing protein [Rhodococcus chondri]|uniref:DUF2252 domain-containing protein n=1 Tax=Rhodococcus chondri TaxID=3065941 RepID=A0ABU7JR64_9NOCA|nr:DUF2252 domain-containing protein [Rhodococcus sp. CC-R104]MEE2032227.1 DUF2252 domain-containing protein [Rhodococcus sp. CC-R104]